jgi:hypothetical protein
MKLTTYLKNYTERCKFLILLVTGLVLNPFHIFSQTTYTFNYSGSFQTFTVPANVSVITVTVSGASGGGSGGGGARFVNTLTVTPGSVLRIYVGGSGIVGASAAGGFNGGGTAGYNYSNEGSGGGASDIRISPYALADRIIVAGGGGGNGGWAGGAGGAAGLNGTAGQNGQGWGGGGGTSSAGGAGGSGNGCGNGAAGSLGQGGAGGGCTIGGGGGGGGYYGGGGGGGDNNGCCADGGGGGGGSSFCAISGGTCTSGVQSGHGRVLISVLQGVNISLLSPVQCNGQTNGALTATAQGGAAPYSYLWQPGSVSGATLSGIGAGIYTVTATDANSVVYTATYNLSNPPLLGTTLVSQQSITCSGGSNGSAYVLGTGGVTPYQYNWYPYGGTNAFASGLTAGVYTVEVTDGSNCVATRTIAINQPAPLQIVAFSTKQVVCAGESVTLIGGGANSYSWTGGVSNGVAFVPAATASYVVTGMNFNGCTGSAFTTVSVNPTPLVTMTGSATACFGNSVTLTASGASTYTWSNNDLGSTVSLSPSVSTIYTVTGSNSFGCSSSTSTLVTILPLPNVQMIISDSVICMGQSVTFNESGASTYTWNPSTNTGVPYFLTGSQSFMLSGTGSNGCINSDTRTVTVHQLPVLSISGPTLMCAGINTVLSVTGASSYTWSGGPVSSTFIVSPSNTITYSVTGTDTNGCQQLQTHFMQVLPSPVVTLVSSSPVCEGDSVNLSASGAVSYTWLPVQSSNQNITVTPTVSTTYSVLGIGNNGCVRTVTTLVVVNPAPNLTLTAPSLICAGNSATFVASGAPSYSWNNGSTAATLVVSPPVTTTYTITGTGTNGCPRNVVHQLVVEPYPPLNPVSTHSNFCIGHTATLSAVGAVTFTWMPGNTNQSFISVSPTSTSIYTVSGSSLNGCLSTATIEVFVNALPVVAITGPTIVCRGHQALLVGTGADTYSWSTGFVGGTASVSPSSPSTYSVIGTDIKGCQSSATINLAVKDSPTIAINVSGPADTLCAGDPVTLSASGGLSYVWNTSDTTQAVTVFPSVGSSYTVTGLGPNGCTTDAVWLSDAQECTGINNAGFMNSVIQLYPNPNTGSFTLSAPGFSLAKVFNLSGQVIRVVELRAEDVQQVTLTDLSRGVYFIQFNTTGAKQIVTKKLIIH